MEKKTEQRKGINATAFEATIRCHNEIALNCSRGLPGILAQEQPAAVFCSKRNVSWRNRSILQQRVRLAPHLPAFFSQLLCNSHSVEFSISLDFWSCCAFSFFFSFSVPISFSFSRSSSCHLSLAACSFFCWFSISVAFIASLLGATFHS